jgi:hypothetical protein
MGGQDQTLVMGLHRHHRDRAFHQAVQVEILLVRRKVACLDARNIERLVDQLEQRMGRRVDDPRELLLLLVERRFREQVGGADDAVQRRAQLVAHVGEKGRLGLAGLDGTRGGVMQLAHQRNRIQRHRDQHQHEAQAPGHVDLPEGDAGDDQAEACQRQQHRRQQIRHAVAKAVAQRHPQIDCRQRRTAFAGRQQHAGDHQGVAGHACVAPLRRAPRIDQSARHQPDRDQQKADSEGVGRAAGGFRLRQPAG